MNIKQLSTLLVLPLLFMTHLHASGLQALLKKFDRQLDASVQETRLELIHSLESGPTLIKSSEKKWNVFTTESKT